MDGIEASKWKQWTKTLHANQPMAQLWLTPVSYNNLPLVKLICIRAAQKRQKKKILKNNRGNLASQRTPQSCSALNKKKKGGGQITHKPPRDSL